MTSSSSRDKNIHGKLFEKFVHENFKDLHIQLPIEWKRVVDSAAAGNIIAKADGDFELTVNSGDFGRPYRFRIECKASILNETMAVGFRSLIKVDQDAKMRLALRAGICGVYLYEAVQNQEIEIWYAKPVCEAYPHKRKPFHGRPAYVISRTNFARFAELWATDPGQILNKLLLTDRSTA